MNEFMQYIEEADLMDWEQAKLCINEGWAVTREGWEDRDLYIENWSNIKGHLYDLFRKDYEDVDFVKWMRVNIPEEESLNDLYENDWKVISVDELNEMGFSHEHMASVGIIYLQGFKEEEEQWEASQELKGVEH